MVTSMALQSLNIGPAVSGRQPCASSKCCDCVAFGASSTKLKNRNQCCVAAASATRTGELCPSGGRRRRCRILLSGKKGRSSSTCGTFSRSAAFTCLAFAGSQRGGGGDGAPDGKVEKKLRLKTKHQQQQQQQQREVRKRAVRGTPPDDDGSVAAAMEPTTDLRACISNAAAIPILIEDLDSAEASDVSLQVLEGTSSDDSECDELEAGDPLGRKVLGRGVVKWMMQGMRAMANEVASALERGDSKGAQELMGTGHNLVMIAQPYLAANPIPQGLESICLKASMHYPTVFDHFQRELRLSMQLLQERGVVDDWKSTEAWKLLKKFAKSGEHRAVARKAHEPRLVHELLGLTREEVKKTQRHIDAFVLRALELLQIERDAELDATQLSLEGASSVIGAPRTAVPVPTDQDCDERGVEQCDSITNLTPTGSTTGLGGMHLVTLSIEGGGHLPPTTISPGDMVCVRISDKRRGGSTMECMRGSVYSLGEDGSSIAVAIEARYGDPTFSRLFGKSLRLDRISALADATTYQRDCEALERLQKRGLLKKNPAAAVVATLFGEGPDVCWLAQNGPSSSNSFNDTTLPEDTVFDGSQRRAIQMGLNRRRPVVVIQGPPGTGKTSVVTELICRTVACGERVLATAPTNAAVDNMVEKLAIAGLNVVRVGNPTRVAPAVSAKSLSYIVDRRLGTFRRDLARRRADLRSDLRQCLGDDSMAAGIRQVLKQLGRTLKQREKEAILEALSSAQVVLCTNTGAGDPLVRNLDPFDLVVVDEAAQAIEPSCWIPLLQGRRCVLTGDMCQLAPTIMSREAMEHGLGMSLMERAAGLHKGILSTMLSVQYRMHEAIALWASKEMYGGRLMSAPSVETHLLLDSPGVKATSITRLPMLLLDTRLPFGSLIPGCEELLDPAGTGSFYNEGEADIVVEHITALLAAGAVPYSVLLKPCCLLLIYDSCVSANSIAVQSPYMAQVQLLCDRIEAIPGTEGIEVASIDSFQGREADAVVISMVRSNNLGLVGFLGDNRRMNVAVTRARKHVAIVCDSSTVGRNAFLQRLLQHIRLMGEVRCAYPTENPTARLKSPLVNFGSQRKSERQ